LLLLLFLEARIPTLAICFGRRFKFNVLFDAIALMVVVGGIEKGVDDVLE
jgi:hypothetical protein